MEKTYRDFLVETVDYLIKAESDIFMLALNLSMKSDLKEIDDVFETGDKYTFDLEHLDNSSDVNVQKVVDLIKSLQATVDSLINLNAIKDDEFPLDFIGE